MLIGKQTLVGKQIPFVGSKYARFKSGDVIIELEAPHMSFTMTVTYMTAAFERVYQASRRGKKKREQRQF